MKPKEFIPYLFSLPFLYLEYLHVNAYVSHGLYIEPVFGSAILLFMATGVHLLVKTLINGRYVSKSQHQHFDFWGEETFAGAVGPGQIDPVTETVNTFVTGSTFGQRQIDTFVTTVNTYGAGSSFGSGQTDPIGSAFNSYGIGSIAPGQLDSVTGAINACGFSQSPGSSY